jgi:hypothetical protein
VLLFFFTNHITKIELAKKSLIYVCLHDCLSININFFELSILFLPLVFILFFINAAQFSKIYIVNRILLYLNKNLVNKGE